MGENSNFMKHPMGVFRLEIPRKLIDKHSYIIIESSFFVSLMVGSMAGIIGSQISV